MQLDGFFIVIMQGWIQLHRKLIDWEWYTDGNVLRLFIHLLLKANHKDVKWRGINVCKGQLITGRKVLSAETGMSEQQIRTALNKLESTNEITIKTTNLNSLISINNWLDYQIINQRNNQQITNDQPTNNQQITTNNNDNNDNNDNNVVVSAAELKEFLTNLPQDKINLIKEISMFSGDEKQYNELMKKFCVEFIGRYGLHKTENEAIEIWQSWLSKERGKKKKQPVRDSFDILEESFKNTKKIL